MVLLAGPKLRVLGHDIAIPQQGDRECVKTTPPAMSGAAIVASWLPSLIAGPDLISRFVLRSSRARNKRRKN